ncbi:hypothetical protein HF086_015173 [Spodoptera exigua]|uniref:Inosine/uridine-preferring nucleoside hydrolase domain-containing protein n=1 Tax=Spodoptera exigua TaxID=7107 RepID=A0A922MCM9_SPOEX|nr:hypothetical protein HF086_015173 [Spodoptera exigua]
MSLLNEKYFDGSITNFFYFSPVLVALTTTFGNVNLTQAIINSDRFLALCDRRDIPIYSGAHKALVSDMESDYFYGMDGLGDTGYESPLTIDIEKEPAAVALLELSKKYEGEGRGLNTNDFSSSEPNTRLVYKANVERYKKFLLDVYSAELNP